MRTCCRCQIRRHIADLCPGHNTSDITDTVGLLVWIQDALGPRRRSRSARVRALGPGSGQQVGLRLGGRVGQLCSRDPKQVGVRSRRPLGGADARGGGVVRGRRGRCAVRVAEGERVCAPWCAPWPTMLNTMRPGPRLGHAVSRVAYRTAVGLPYRLLRLRDVARVPGGVERRGVVAPPAAAQIELGRLGAPRARVLPRRRFSRQVSAAAGRSHRRRRRFGAIAHEGRLLVTVR